MSEKVILYSTGCPKCMVLKSKLQSKNIPFDEVNDTETMMSIGITKVPVLCVDSTMMEFGVAVKWVNTYEGGNL